MSKPCTPATPPVSDVQIRVARREEYTEVGLLTVAGYDADGYLTHHDGSRDEDYAAWLRDGATRGRDGFLLVAVAADNLIGTATWCPPGSPFRELATQPWQGEFRTLSVLPAGRGHGVGRALVQWCLARARESGLREIVLSSLPAMAPAHRLYESLGFVRRPDLDWSPYVGVDLWGFSLALESANTL